MNTVTIRDLRYDFSNVERMLREGQSLRVTKRGKVIARLVPDGPEEAAAQRARLMDSMAALKELYGDEILEPPPADLIYPERDDLP